MEFIINLFKSLTEIQQWFSLITTFLIIAGAIFFVLWGGFKIKTFEFFGIRNKDKEKNLPDYLKTFIWSRDIKSNGIKIGKIGFLKDIVIFKFFGFKWNSADPETKEGLSVFEDEFFPPDFLSEDIQRTLECFIFLDSCNIQTKMIAKIKERSKYWNHVYVIASRKQIENQELDLLLLENGGPENLTVLRSSRAFN